MAETSANKGKARPTRAPIVGGLYRADSVKDVADSLGITNLPDNVAAALASDVEYRLHQVIEEAARFTRHARRSTMSPSDIDQALRVLNIEPLYGHSSAHTPTFRRAVPQHTLSQSIYFLEDEEIDFDKALKEEVITVPPPVRYTAHWLAIEGIQPLVPENPTTSAETKPAGTTQGPPSPRTRKQGVAAPTTNTGATTPTTAAATLVKHALPRELQLYHDRLSSALISGNERKRTAALSSLRADAGLQALLPYLIRWVGETVVRVLKGEGATHAGDDGSDDDAMIGSDELDRAKLDIMLDALKALLDNKTLFVEPYLHQIMPPILSILLTASLGSSSSFSSFDTNPPPRHVRMHAASLLSHVLNLHGPTYPSLGARVLKTLILGATAPGRQRGTREGALRGLAALGRVAAGRALVGARALKTIEGEIDVGSEVGSESVEDLVQGATVAMHALHPIPTPAPQLWGEPQIRPLEPSSEEDRALLDKLSEYFGQFFTMRVVVEAGNAQWAHGLLEAIESSKSEYLADATESTK
ncbi:Transcription initiation factor TFIID subunit 6 OS=Schizosaccharomyces pombe (strain 972 / ATCC 24843) GN=taf6 PE=1 SV=1 [Rhizoctonia solani AG-1 IB]|uniref:TBP-associated factor 6 n=1 Tax=Thanatephorus cucumeris (strain AG1-IB / isolate 7/3/14) TaxID=1108050 RepID=A0A0B7G2A8_THACB|nr:Transcription initiation factor TFIID subunit 6 OS=Schizosaccharomyces pombe (strain 972 / ATCC 24843) GN=taf6 PE=1 SV=1 [Rhizoctonia solani AG-1 IB]